MKLKSFLKRYVFTGEKVVFVQNWDIIVKKRFALNISIIIGFNFVTKYPKLLCIYLVRENNAPFVIIDIESDVQFVK